MKTRHVTLFIVLVAFLAIFLVSCDQKVIQEVIAETQSEISATPKPIEENTVATKTPNPTARPIKTLTPEPTATPTKTPIVTTRINVKIFFCIRAFSFHSNINRNSA